MAGEWEDLTLGDLGRVVTGKTPLTAVEGNFGGQIPFVTPSDMDGRKTISTTARNLTETGAASVRGSKIPVGSVMVSCIGSDMGKAVIAGRDCVTNQQINSIVVDDRFSSEFVYYNLSTRKHEIRHQAAGGSAQPILNKGDFSRLEITLPPLADQKAIAAVLGALDDKIELNRRMNVTLESMARALFQSWFVDFDPVRAKLDGRRPSGLDEATAALFPSTFQDSPLGPIPHGWVIKPFGELADVNWGDTSTTKKSYVPEGFTAFSAAGPDGLLPYHDYDRTGVVVSAIGSAGLSWLALGKWSCIKNTIRFWATAPGISTEYLYQVTKGQEKWPIRGSVQPFISQGDARAMRILAPANGLSERFGEVVRPWLTKIEANKTGSRTLATLRDTLLPKLLSGELSVAETKLLK